MNIIRGKLYSIMNIFESRVFFTLIRKSLISMIPLIITGGLALMLKSLPIPAYQNFLASFMNGLLILIFSVIYNSCLGMFSISMVISLSYKYAMYTLKDTGQAQIVTLVAFSGYFVLCADLSAQDLYNTDSYNAGYLFCAILCSYFTVVLFKYFSKISIGKSKFYTLNSDAGFVTAISSLIPAAFVLIIFCLINLGISEFFNVKGIQGLFTYLCSIVFANLGKGFLSMIIYTLSVQIMWFFGVHGNNVLSSVFDKDFSELGSNIFSKCFYDIYINIGGSGTILCVVIAILIVSKNREIKYVTKAGFLPVIFNISEIISIGIPILFNPFFLIPFLLVPIISGTIAYAATSLGLVPVISTSVEWTTPVIYSGYIATGSFLGSLLQIVIIIIGVILYIPFVKLYDSRLHEDAKLRVRELTEYVKESENSQKPLNLLDRNDSLGQTAKVLAQELRLAVENGGIYFKYQPQTNRLQKCIGCETLVRWDHPIAGAIYPPLIVQLAIESGLLPDIENILVDSSCNLIKRIQDEFGQTIKVSLNLCVASFSRENFNQFFANAIKKYNIDSSSLCIELTENDVYASNDLVEDKILILQKQGHKMIIDDFGMGHTSLKYLQVNRFDTVKLDGTLTRDIETNAINQNIIKSICKLGDDLGFDVIAEFVETQSQKKVLDSLGCTYYQGYLYSPAITMDEFIEYYSKHNFIVNSKKTI